MKKLFWIGLTILASGCFMEEAGIQAELAKEKKPVQEDRGKLVKAVTLRPSSANIKGIGQELKLIVVVIDENNQAKENENLPFEWNSSNQNVATVTTSGIVKAVSAGEALITVKVGSHSAAVTIVVEATPSRESAINASENPPPPVRRPADPVSSKPPTPSLPLPSSPPDPGSSPPPPPPSPPSPSSSPDPVSSKPPTPPSPPPAKEAVPCKKVDSYAAAVVSFKKGENGGFNGDKLPGIVLGPPRGAGEMMGSFDVLSLGKGGEIILEFKNCMIVNEQGPDFTVFENPFILFPEPGFVGISQDGVSFVEFPCNLDEASYPGCAGVHPVFANPDLNAIDPTDPAVSGGDSFDLSALGFKNARYVRIRDSGLGLGPIGCPVTPDQCTWGFDLDAIAIVNGVVP